jgi:UDP-N-acetylenolpyruvoylglucosamine reductase
MTLPSTPSDHVGYDKTAATRELARHVSAQTVLRVDEPLGRRTTLRVGGPADIYVEPASEEDLVAVLKWRAEHSLPIFVLGRGSNLLVRDNGFRGLVICLNQGCFIKVQVFGQQLRCGAGVKLKVVAVEARRNGVTELEFLEGIPGSVGGALRMNAGAMGGAMFEVVRTVRLMDLNGLVQEKAPAQMDVQYRSCSSVKDKIALSAVLQGRVGKPQEIASRMDEFSRKRWKSQPAAPSAGCMFKNPPGVPAGKLIDELGLKGTRVGGAVVSLEHGNFLVNEGSATALDVLELIELIRQTARAERGVELETEVEVIGE